MLPTTMLLGASNHHHDDNNNNDNQDDESLVGPLPTLSDVLACQISQWYPHFAKLPPTNALGRTKATIRTLLVPLPDKDSDNDHDDESNDVAEQALRDYLLADGVYLPDDCPTSTLLSSSSGRVAGEWSSSDSSDSDSDHDHDTDHVVSDNDHPMNERTTTRTCSPAMMALAQQITNAIATLGGAVVPKLNWSGPKDAAWVNGGDLKCCTAGDVLLLLKSSDFCLYDVQHAVQDVAAVVVDDTQDDREDQAGGTGTGGTGTGGTGGPDHDLRTTTTLSKVPLQLALRKWCTLHPSQEFRCFVYRGTLIAACQRNHSQHFPHLRVDRWIIRELLHEFYTEIMQCVAARAAAAALTATTTTTNETTATNTKDTKNDPALPRWKLPESYCFDAYIDQDRKVWLIDINVWGRRTDTLLFTWKELYELGSTGKLSRCSHDDDDGLWEDDEDINSDEEDNDDLPILRIVETSKQVRHDPLASYRAPVDTLHVAGMAAPAAGGGADEDRNHSGAIGTKNFESFMKLCERPSVLEAEQGSDDDDDNNNNNTG